MRKFIKEFLDINKKTKILEVGSCQIESNRPDFNYKRYFVDNPNWEHIGLNIEPGKNVDIVSKNLYKYPFEDNSFDVVISGSTLEHVEDIYAWIKEIARITNDLVFILVPNSAPEHKRPLDCWRIFPDGMKFLIEDIGGLKILKCEKSNKDTIGIAKKIIKNT
jgi:hypothetical protein